MMFKLLLTNKIIIMYLKIKSKYKWLSAVSALLLLSSCYDDGFEEFVAPDGNVNDIQPNTLFTTSNVAGDLDVDFRSYSTDAVSYSWDFGDEVNTSTEADPTFTYSDGGTYTITLETVSSDGLTATASEEITIFSTDLDYTLVDNDFNVVTANGAESITWDFGDGNTSEDLLASNVYTELGTYTITYTATLSDGRSVSGTEEITVTDLPAVPDFSYSASGETVTFTDLSTLATSYSWDFGDGVGTSTDQNPVYTYSADGSYDVILTVTNSVGVERSTTISVLVGGVTASFAAVIQNGDMQTYPTTEMNNNDLVDAWTVDPDNTFNDGTASIYNFWRNDALEAWVQTPANNGGTGTTDKASSSGTDAASSGGTSGRSLKFDSSGERAYQPFEVESGVEYSISAFVKSETTPVGDVQGTFYILSEEPADDTDLDSIALVSLEATVSSSINTWEQYSFDFTATSTFNFSSDLVDEDANDILTSVDQDFVIFYFVPTNTVTSDNEVFLTDIVIETPSYVAD